MNRSIVLMIALALFIGNHSLGQTAKKEHNAWSRELKKIKTSEIRSGQHLHLAKLFSATHFMEYYVAYGKIIHERKYRGLIINELYKDADYTYFAREVLNDLGLVNFFKVATRDLSGIDYASLDGNEIRERFIEEMIPQTDKERVKRKEKNCTTARYAPGFDYKYIPGARELVITYKWKISCDHIYRIINKTYTATYSLHTRHFSNLITDQAVR